MTNLVETEFRYKKITRIPPIYKRTTTIENQIKSIK